MATHISVGSTFTITTDEVSYQDGTRFYADFIFSVTSISSSSFNTSCGIKVYNIGTTTITANNVTATIRLNGVFKNYADFRNDITPGNNGRVDVNVTNVPLEQEDTFVVYIGGYWEGQELYSRVTGIFTFTTADSNLINFNGNEVNNIYFNGTQVNEVYFNGTQIR